MDFDERWKQKRAYYQSQRQVVQGALQDIELDRDGDLASQRRDILQAVIATMLIDIAQSLAWLADKE